MDISSFDGMKDALIHILAFSLLKSTTVPAHTYDTKSMDDKAKLLPASGTDLACVSFIQTAAYKIVCPESWFRGDCRICNVKLTDIDNGHISLGGIIDHQISLPRSLQHRL